MFVLGVTGEFGSGKSTVAAMFKKAGYKVVDADKIVHGLFKDDPVCLKKIRQAFGKDVVGSRGVDRVKLGARVFGNAQALKKLEGIVHPLAKAKVQGELKKLRSIPIVLDVPLLIEAGWADMVDLVVVVKASRESQVRRIEKRMGLSRREIVQRLRRQMPVREKLKFADMVVDNSGTLADTDKQVKKIVSNLRKTIH